MAEVPLPVHLLLPDINPEPWTTPVVGRNYANKRPKLRAYQNAVRATWDRLYSHWEPIQKGTLLEVRFTFSRSSADGKQADATNLGKATEDALQGRLFHNDRHNRRVTNLIIDQTPRTSQVGVMISVLPFELPVADVRLWDQLWEVYGPKPLAPSTEDEVWRDGYDPTDDF